MVKITYIKLIKINKNIQLICVNYNMSLAKISAEVLECAGTNPDDLIEKNKMPKDCIKYFPKHPIMNILIYKNYTHNNVELIHTYTIIYNGNYTLTVKEGKNKESIYKFKTICSLITYLFYSIKSWGSIKSMGSIIAIELYEKLFEDYPVARPVLESDYWKWTRDREVWSKSIIILHEQINNKKLYKKYLELMADMIIC